MNLHRCQYCATWPAEYVWPWSNHLAHWFWYNLRKYPLLNMRETWRGWFWFWQAGQWW